MGFVRTVAGDVEASLIGPVTMHEHLLFDIVRPGSAGDRQASIGMETRWQIDYRSNEFPANAHQQDVDVAAAELVAFAGDGGGLLVDQTVSGLARDPAGLLAASQRSGVHVVAAAGTYTDAFLDDATRAMDIDALAERFRAEVETGLDGTPIRAGLIGEMGCSWPLTDTERRALKAAARASIATGAALSVHPGRSPEACREIVDIVEGEDADLSRVVICHMDRTYPNGEGIEDLLRRGVCVEWDFFGIEQSHYWMGDVELPTDRQRVRLIDRMAQKGFADRLLVSQDICTRTRLTRFGGHGYGHILRNVQPLMQLMGLAEDLIGLLLRGTPLRLLALKEKFA